MSMTESEVIEVFRGLLDVPCEMLVEYASVATEEQKKALVRIRCAEEMAIYALSEIQQYRTIGTVSEFRELKEKATEKKPVPYVPDCASINFIEFVCPNCNGDVPQMLTPRYCDCGQKLDWSEGKE